jgi:hypothetical protein
LISSFVLQFFLHSVSDRLASPKAASGSPTVVGALLKKTNLTPSRAFRGRLAEQVTSATDVLKSARNGILRNMTDNDACGGLSGWHALIDKDPCPCGEGK